MSAGGADVLVVGAGAYGLSCAWWMAQRHTGARVVVVDQGDFASGATGRNGAGIRMQWGLELNVRLCQESIGFFEEAAGRLEYPRGIDLKQDGYLLVARSDETLERAKQGVSLQRSLGVPSELLEPEQCLELVPALQPRGLRGGAFCARDGGASPFLWLDALQRAVRHEGVTVRYRTRVRGIEPRSGDFLVTTDAGPMTAGRVLLCTDWAVPELLEPLAVDLPITGLPKEGLVLEPSAPVVGPVLVDLDNHLSVNQTRSGTTVCTVGRDRERGGDNASTPDFLRFAARRIVDLLPGFGDLRVLRTWGGVSSETPDMQPVLGATAVPGLFVAVSAYRGFMTSPAAGRLMAGLVLDGSGDDPILAALRPGRFAAGELVREPLLNA